MGRILASVYWNYLSIWSCIESSIVLHELLYGSRKVFSCVSLESLLVFIVLSNSRLNAAKSAASVIPKEGAIGLGSGSTVAIFVEELSRRTNLGEVSLSVVPSSYQAYQLAVKYQIPLTNLDSTPELLLTVDGADEVDRNLNLIKGGGGALFQEKIVAFASKKLVIIIDESKIVEKLGSKFPVPIEVLPFSLGVVKKAITKMGITPILREAKEKMGPVVTDNGNFIIDLKFSQPINNLEKLAIDLKMIPGVVETGLFVGMTDEVHVGTEKDVYVLKK